MDTIQARGRTRDTGKGIPLLAGREGIAVEARLSIVCSGSMYIDQRRWSTLFPQNLNLQRLLRSNWESPSSTGHGESLKESENDGGLVQTVFCSDSSGRTVCKVG